MPLDFTNIIKGRITETLLMALFERGGYRVTRLGIEELFAEVKHLDLAKYQALALPLQLRYLPDLLVVELELTNAFLVEVKFRKKFDESATVSLHAALSKQRQYWPQAYTVIMTSEPFVPEASFHQDYIRVLKPNETDLLIDQNLSTVQRWEKLHHLQRVFKRFNNSNYIHDVQQSADRLTQTLRDLANL